MYRIAVSRPIAVACALVLVAAGAALAQPSTLLNTYVLFAKDNMRIRTATVSDGDLGVNDGLLYLRGAVLAGKSDLVSNGLHFDSTTDCEDAFTNMLVGTSVSCPHTPCTGGAGCDAGGMLVHPLFPDVAIEAIPLFMSLAVIGIIYGALVAMMQPDLKRLIAYSSVSHLGFVMLGIFALNPQGVEGAIYQMLNHGVSTGGLFLLIGMIYMRRHTREISEFGGLWHSVPTYAAIFMLVMLSSIGLPGLNGFVGEFLIMLGGFLRLRLATVFAVIGVILGALYMLWTYERVMFGPITKAINEKIADLTPRELEVLTLVGRGLFDFVLGN
jgi:hypothetical protein